MFGLRQSRWYTNAFGDSSRVYASYNFYKPHGALSLSPVAATFTRKSNYMSIKYQGKVRLDFVHAMEGAQNRYDWQRKVFVNLNIEQIGNILAGQSFHVDITPNTDKFELGDKRVFRFERVSTEGIFAKMTLESESDTHTISLTEGDGAVLRSLLGNVVPSLAGWSACVDPKPEESNAFDGNQDSGYNDAYYN